MKVLSKEKNRVLAEKNGWSLAYAEGYIDGETCCRRRKTPSMYARIGIDDYSLGFRVGYYKRSGFASTMGFRRLPMARLSFEKSEGSTETIDVMPVPAHSG